MSEITAFSARDITTRERLEDYATDAQIVTKGGLNLQIALVCDGAGGGEEGELAAKLTSRSILDYLEIGDETEIPHLLTRAIEEANRVVHNELSGTASSTVAMIAIDLDDGEQGRMYIASVGDSFIYLVRDKQLVRLNTSHTLANEYIIAGQMTAKEANSLDGGDDLIRSVGMGPQINVDIGFYAERGKDFVPAKRAFDLGIKGLALKEGDTIFAASDGLFGINPDDKKPYLHEDEIMRFALDNDVERTTTALMRFAGDRRPKDNTALSVLFVPSRERRPVRLISLSRTQKMAIGIGSFLSLCIISILFVALFNSASQRNQLEEEAQGTQNALGTAVALAQDPGGVTPTPTPTITPTPRARPTISALGQVGFQFFEQEDSRPIFIGDSFADPVISYLSIEGEEGVLNNRYIFNPGEIYLQPDTLVRLDNVDDTLQAENMRMTIARQADIFARNGQFVNQGVTVNLFDSAQLEFHAETDCIAVRHLPADITISNDHDKVAFTCFTGNSGDCSYTIADNEPIDMTIGRRVLIDIENLELIESGPILFPEVRTYYETVMDLTGEESRAECFLPFLDEDGDGVRFPIDECPNEGEAGLVTSQGCPDSDQDTIPDTDDLCPNDFGPVSNNGCPLADSDGDGYNDGIDQCPFDDGSNPPGFGVDTVGCPLTSQDTDNDGIPDINDACPDDGDRSDNPNTPFIDENGCPLDTDEDGVPDSEDQCPTQGAETSGVDEDGCPIPDQDDDGVPDDEDQCPLEGDLGNGVDENGCQIIDSDLDGIPDGEDQCPFNGNLDANGENVAPDDPTLVTPIDPNTGCPDALDSDGDGVLDQDDVCPNGNDNIDTDDDGIPNACDDDIDGDGVLDEDDQCRFQGDEFGFGVDANGCPITQPPDTDGDGVPNVDDLCPTQGDAGNGVDTDGCPLDPATPFPSATPFLDADGDGVGDATDNCVNDPNPGQADFNTDGEGDACDHSDGDGIVDAADSCPTQDGTPANNGCPDSCSGTDYDGDTTPDPCDSDIDGDGILNASDVCLVNPGGDPASAQDLFDSNDNHDLDGDGIPNGCDMDDDGDGINDGVDPDRDNDNVLNADDRCDGYNDYYDVDGDGIPNGCDPDDDNDGTTNFTDTDDDGDGVPDTTDICPGGDDALDADNDGIPNACDLDSDDDGTPDECPFGSPGCGTDDNDDDNDGVPDGSDVCSIGNDNYDTDGDGIPNACDTDDDGDGNPDNTDIDDDNDGFTDNIDVCPIGDDALDADADGIPDACDPDDDNDGVPDTEDVCPGGNDNFDYDGDGIPVACDNILDAPDTDNDGIPNPFDGDDDNDGIPDGSDFDDDNDGTIDFFDSCPGFPDFLDMDSDGIPDGCDTDVDGDGVVEVYEVCQGGNDFADADGDLIPDDCDPDDDNDGVLDGADQCPGGNDNFDADGDGIPNDCDTDDDADGLTDDIDADDDGDGVQDDSDICPAGDDNANVDGDAIPDACDTDDDGDGILDVNEVAPACIILVDCDGDTVQDNNEVAPICVQDNDCDDDNVLDGDEVASICVQNPDCDGDGVTDDLEAVGCVQNPDCDGDGVLDGADVCPTGDDNLDNDADTIPDACDDDDDNDTILDVNDDCQFVAGIMYVAQPNANGCPDEGEANHLPTPRTPDGIPDVVDNCFDLHNPAQDDFDNDGLGDLCDPDDDNDGIPDGSEAPGCQFDDTCRLPTPVPTQRAQPTQPPAPSQAPIILPTADLDSDGDGVPNSLDICPRGDDKLDADGDGIPDACDT